jgi:hypothetical protein
MVEKIVNSPISTAALTPVSTALTLRTRPMVVAVLCVSYYPPSLAAKIFSNVSYLIFDYNLAKI